VLIDQYRRRAALKRSALFRHELEPLPRPMRIVDLGGSEQMWQRWQFTERDGIEVVLANHHLYDTSHRDEAHVLPFVSDWTVDVRALTASDLSAFDLIFSNSMIEHLPSRSDQEALAHRIAESGRPYFIQIPNKHCVVDPHFPHPLAMFFACWPRSLQAQVLARHPLGSARVPTTVPKALQALEDTYHPLSRKDLAALFPQAHILTEWNLGLPMSLVAIGGRALH
jgi:hypothetical protein